MDDAAVWALEERFWTGGAAHYATALDPACVMAFPAPTGILAGPEIAASLTDAPRWATVAMTERRIARPSPDLLVLGYRASGRRQATPGETADPYDAYCTSVYRRTGDPDVAAGVGWRLVQHQQTPAA